MFDNFAKEKSDFLRKKDKSRKGSIDRDIVDLINLINSKKDFYTTSSCAGRIVLLEMKSRKKNDCEWIFSKHDKVNLKEIINALKKNKNQSRERPLKAGSELVSEVTREPRISQEETSFKIGAEYPIWFKQQPIILHIACRNIDAAKKLLDLARKVFKRSAILSITDRKTTIEIIGNERMDTIIADRNFVADEKYLKNLIKYANNNFAENKRKSEMFLKLIKRS